MLKVGVIGCGYWGPNLIRNFIQIKDCNMKICCDLSDDKLQRIKSLYPNVRTTKNLDELLEDEDIDAVAIATPVSAHGEIGLKCLEHNKHVLVEKPLATSSKECINSSCSVKI